MTHLVALELLDLVKQDAAGKSCPFRGIRFLSISHDCYLFWFQIDLFSQQDRINV